MFFEICGIMHLRLSLEVTYHFYFSSVHNYHFTRKTYSPKGINNTSHTATYTFYIESSIYQVNKHQQCHIYKDICSHQ